jgi:hypothetical protein
VGPVWPLCNAVKLVAEDQLFEMFVVSVAMVTETTNIYLIIGSVWSMVQAADLIGRDNSKKRLGAGR